MISEAQVLKALSVIIDPDFKQDIVSLGFIKNLRIHSGLVSFDIELTTPACPIKTEFQRAAERAVMALEGVESVNVNMTHRRADLGNQVNGAAPDQSDWESDPDDGSGSNGDDGSGSGDDGVARQRRPGQGRRADRDRAPDALARRRGPRAEKRRP